jgi:methylenetetrahydrofolate dehydrogenase (NADP+)/methenyltetrahydrofolate cyclohydrolase
MTMIINGKTLAQKVKERVKQRAAKMTIQPGLGMILLGDHPASKIYVLSKERACKKMGFYAKTVVLPTSTSQEKLLAEIKQLKRNPKIHGILVQLPLPLGFDGEKVVETIGYKKDVDCIHPFNIGQLASLKSVNLENLLVSCTVKGVIRLIESTKQSIAGKKAVVVGRSNLVGKPMALLLLAENATVTICHSKTQDLKKETKQADILVVAVGKPGLITADMVKKGAIVIDVGINRIGKRIVGDVDFEAVRKVAGYITPVPGGVGPMTIACLLENTLLLTKTDERV